MYNNILVPIEPAHIEEADPTLDLAEHMKSEDGQIILLSVVEEFPSYVAAQVPEELLGNAKTGTLKELKALVAKREMDATILVKIGHAATTVKSVQKDRNCDLIIVSSHKPTTVDYVLGSTASKVVRRAQCPVFVTR